MTSFTEGRHAGEFILSEASGKRSRENVTIEEGNDLSAGTPVYLSSGTYREFTNPGSQAAVGVLYAAVDASGGDAPGVIIARDAEVNGECLVLASGVTLDDVATDLAAVGIIVRRNLTE